MPTVLVVDDDAQIRSTLGRMLGRFGCKVIQAADGVEGATALAAAPKPDLVITDMEMPRADGFAVLAAGQKAGVPVVILTAHATLERAVEAMKRGAANFLAKPFAMESVEAVLRDSLGPGVQRTEARRDSGQFRPPLGEDDSFRQILGIVNRVAATNATILITGESGTGKEVVARAIHNASRRADHPFVPVNCGAIPEALLESELFGHARGAFTGATQARRGRFQLADGGTMFLDEIGDMPMPLQVKLLRVLQERSFEVLGESQPVKVDLRVIAATHRNLEEWVAEGKFREDLYYRLNVVPLHLPPLRERTGDIPLLVQHFVVEASKAHGQAVTGIEPEAMAALVAYRWPGNVRELANIIERMVVMRGSGLLTVDDVPAMIRSPRPAGGTSAAAAGAPLRLPNEGLDLTSTLQQIEGTLIDEALARTRGNRSQAAALLRINRTTLVEKLKRRGDGSEG